MNREQMDRGEKNIYREKNGISCNSLVQKKERVEWLKLQIEKQKADMFSQKHSNSGMYKGLLKTLPPHPPPPTKKKKGGTMQMHSVEIVTQ